MWTQIEPLLPVEPPKPKGGRPRNDNRKMMNAIFYVLRTGIQWKALPRSLGAGSSAHDRFQEWQKAGTLIGLGVAYAGYGVVGYVLTRTIFTTLSGPAYFLLTRHVLPDYRFRLGLHKFTLRRVSGYVGYGTFNRIIGSLVSRLDQTLIGIWVGVAAAGIYAVPFMIVNSLGYMIAYMLGFISPMASELHSLGQLERLRDIFTRSTRFITALAGMVFVPLLVLGDLFLRV